MKLSTRARYGVRLMIALAVRYGQGPVYLKDIARTEEISEKYLSLIIIPLRSAGLVNSSRGAHGGYSLARNPSRITLQEIIGVLEGDPSLVECVKNPSVCRRVSTCVSHDLWTLLNKKISDVLSSITLDTLVEMKNEKVDQSAMQNI
jgi:Rrf2 family protein